MATTSNERATTRYEQEGVFETLNAINCNEHTEKKGNLTYLSWAWAWQIIKKHYPTATQRTTTWTDANGRERNYNTYDNGLGGYVEVKVTIYEMEITEQLPIMDNRNLPIPTEKLNPFVVNTAIKRCLAKAIAMHGLGLYIYAGEDIPQAEADDAKAKEEAMREQIKQNAMQTLEKCQNADEVAKLWVLYKSLQADAEFKDAVTNKGKAFKEAEKAKDEKK